MQGFTTEQAIALSGCTARQLQYWDEKGLASPSLQASEGVPGKPRIYSYQDLVKIRTIKKMLDRGLSLQKINRAYDYLVESTGFDEPFSEAKLITDGDTIFKVCRNDDEILDTLKEGQLVFFVDLESVSREVQDRVHEYERDREDFIQMLVASD